MTALDIFVLLLLGGGALVGFIRGFVHEVLALAAWVVGVAALKAFHSPVAERLVEPVGTAAGASAAAFVLVFLPAYLAVRFLARFAGGRTRKSIVGPVDRVLGAGFGMLKGLIGATLVFLLANLATDIVYGRDGERPAWMAQSRTFPLLNASGKAVVDWVQTRRHPGVNL